MKPIACDNCIFRDESLLDQNQYYPCLVSKEIKIEKGFEEYCGKVFHSFWTEKCYEAAIKEEKRLREAEKLLHLKIRGLEKEKKSLEKERQKQEKALAGKFYQLEPLDHLGG